MNAVLVSVDYTDLLRYTLPYNRAHFDHVLIVTTAKDQEAVQSIADRHEAEVYVTDAFYRKGATFNKWLALEEALDKEDYRHGWLCIMDADVLWPQSLEVQDDGDRLIFHPGKGEPYCAIPGQLLSPLRRMMLHLSDLLRVDGRYDAPEPRIILPPENTWRQYEIHRNVNEWAGYSQIFHCDDPVLKKKGTPWHEINWRHAGGADSFFQNLWSADKKVRPPFECLHLGEPGINWFGRASQRLDGTMPDDAQVEREKCNEIWRRRRKMRFEGRDQFAEEKLPRT